MSPLVPPSLHPVHSHDVMESPPPPFPCPGLAHGPQCSRNTLMSPSPTALRTSDSGSWGDSNGVTPSSAPSVPGTALSAWTAPSRLIPPPIPLGRASAVHTTDEGRGHTEEGTLATSTPASGQRPRHRKAGDRKPEGRAAGCRESATRSQGARSSAGVRGALELATDRRSKVTM